MTDAIDLARLQFALNVGVHILFPSITIALAWWLVWFRVRYARTGAAEWLTAYKRWTKVFALSFALGIVTGVVMSFQFGTNWPVYMNRVGNIAGPLLAYEVLTAFFLEATFLGVMLYGAERISGRLHIAATVLVAFGTTLSAFWILALNSWMQTPAGYATSGDGQLIAADWWRVIFNPSFPYRMIHMLLASALTSSFLLAGLSAWRLLRAPEDLAAARALRAGALAAAALAPLQVFVGDQHGLNTLAHQPAKVAAIEALWQTRREAPLVLLALPDEEAKRNRLALEIPGGASLILGHARDAEIKGLSDFAPDTPPVAEVFFAFRVMVGIGMLMWALSWYGCVALRGGRKPGRRLLWAFSGFSFGGWIAVLAGWIVTESGRQPWLVTGLLRTAEAAGYAGEAQLGSSLTGYVVTYAVILVSYIVVLTQLAGSSADAKAAPAAEPGS